MPPKIDTIVYWVRSVSSTGKERIPVYYKGRWQKNCADGHVGDVKARPVSIGPGAFTVTYGASDMENEQGESLFPQKRGVA